MRREQLTEKILDIKRSKDWTWKHITDEFGAKQVEGATIVFVVCDRGDRYLSTGVFPA